jgi:hypothetical protein
MNPLDRWLDARGGGESLAPWFASLVRACTQRAVSVLASVRSADASGAPSLPQDLVNAFALRESLGAPSTVLPRDPSTLVAALAGRTFSRSSLRAALDAWLDIPTGSDADDALLVFSSPLAPPSVPVFSAPPASPSTPPRHSDIRPVSAAEGPPASLEDLARWGETLAASVELAGALRAARSLATNDRDAAEAAFRAAYAKIPRRAERLARGAGLVGAEAPRLLELASTLTARFDATVRGLSTALAADDATVDDLLDLCAAHATASGARSRATLALTGLRADLAETLLPRVIARIPGLRVCAQGLRWTAPTSSERARALADVIEQTPWEDAVHPLREHIGAREVYRVTAYAKLLGAGGRSLDEAATQVESALEVSLGQWLGGLPGPLALLVYADVGVGPADARGARHLGDGTAFAQILPWWIVTVGAAS